MKQIVDSITSRLADMAQIVPNLATAFFVFFAGYILAKFLRKLIGRLLAKSGIDKLADRLNDIELVSKTNVDVKLSTIISSVVYYIVLFVFIMASVEVLGMEAISNIMTDIIDYIPKAISAFFVFVVGILFCDMIKKVVQTACDSLGIASGRLLSNIVFYFLFLNVALITLKQAELQTGFMENNISIIVAGVIFAFSIGYGLASKSLMANMLGAFYTKNRFDLGDEITIDGSRGEVIGLDNTTLHLRVDDGEMMIPLNQLSENKYTIHRKENYLNLEEEDKTTK